MGILRTLLALSVVLDHLGGGATINWSADALRCSCSM